MIKPFPFPQPLAIAENAIPTARLLRLITDISIEREKNLLIRKRNNRPLPVFFTTYPEFWPRR